MMLAGLLLALVVTAYAPALRGGFVWDDDKYVTANPMLTATNGLQEIWFSVHTQSQYFPLVYTTFRVEHDLWGLNPVGYHLVNVLLHGLNAVLVWLLLRRLQVPGAWFAAAIFALHPVNVESVAWVTELKNVESLFFYLLAVMAWLKFLDVPAPPRWLYYGLALAAGLLALFAKTTACTLPAALMLVLWLRGQRFNWSRVFQILPFILIGAVMGLVSIWWEGNLGTYNEDAGLSLTASQRGLLAGRALWFYAGKLLWPVNLSFSYPHWNLNSSQPAQYLPLLGWALVVVGLWFWRKQIGCRVLAGIIFFATALSPLLGFITDYTFRYSYVADHYQYTAAIGLFAVFAAGVASWPATGGLALVGRYWFSAVVLLVLGWLTWQQCGAYKNLETLWRDTIAKNPRSWMAHYNLAMELQDQGRVEEAREHFQDTIAIHPEHVKAQNNLGLLLAESGRETEAIEHYQAALKINPDFVGAQNNLAVALAESGDYAQAVAHLQRAVELDPSSPGLWLNLGKFLKAAGRTDEAIECYRQAAKRFPSELSPLRHLAHLLAETGQAAGAIAVYEQALRLAPNDANLRLELGNVFATQTNYAAAADNYRQALQTEPANPSLHYNLGIVLGLQGQPELERRELTVALRLQPSFSAAEEQLKLLTHHLGN